MSIIKYVAAMAARIFLHQLRTCDFNRYTYISKDRFGLSKSYTIHNTHTHTLCTKHIKKCIE